MSNKIICKIYKEPKIIVKFGEQGLKGDTGVNDHALLTHLDYGSAGHIGFQKLLAYIPEFKAYEIE
jgi:hypothetical protein